LKNNIEAKISIKSSQFRSLLAEEQLRLETVEVSGNSDFQLAKREIKLRS